MLDVVNRWRGVAGSSAPLSADDLEALSTSKFRHSRAADSCADVDWSDPRLLDALTRVYGVDLVCFNYSRPRRRARPERGAWP